MVSKADLRVEHAGGLASLNFLLHGRRLLYLLLSTGGGLGLSLLLADLHAVVVLVPCLERTGGGVWVGGWLRVGVFVCGWVVC